MRTTLLLDLDGTLTDPGPGILGCIRFALERMELAAPPDTELRGWIGPPLLRSFESLTGDPALAQLCLAHYRERFSSVGYRENAVYPCVPEALEALRSAGWRLLLATSKPSIYARRILEHFDLARFIDAAYGSELDGRLSDKGELIGALLASEGLRPALCLMVGDRAHDVRGAAANGVPCLGVLYGYGSAEELREAGALDLVAAAADLPEAAGRAAALGVAVSRPG
jgi:phosphoglycolate phosphatase